MSTFQKTNKLKKGFVQKKEKFERLPMKKYYIFSFFLSVFVVVIALVAYFILPPEIPLFYGFPQSQQQIIGSKILFLPAFIAATFTTLNAYLSIYVENAYLKKVLAFISLLISLLAAITIFKIVFLVGNI